MTSQNLSSICIKTHPFISNINGLSITMMKIWRYILHPFSVAPSMCSEYHNIVLNIIILYVQAIAQKDNIVSFQASFHAQKRIYMIS